MTKEPNKTNEEVIAKIKAEDEAKKKKAAAEKAEKNEAERIAAEQAKDDAEAAQPDPAIAAALKAEADKRLAEIEAAERDEGDIAIQEDPKPSREAKYAKARAAGEKLKLIAMDFPQTTSDEHVVFGRAGIKYTVGDLRDLTGIR